MLYWDIVNKLFRIFLISQIFQVLPWRHWYLLWECRGKDAWCSASQHETPWPHCSLRDDLTVQPWGAWGCSQLIHHCHKADPHGRVSSFWLLSPLPQVLGPDYALHQRREDCVCGRHSRRPRECPHSSHRALLWPQCWKTGSCSCSGMNCLILHFFVPDNIIYLE